MSLKSIIKGSLEIREGSCRKGQTHHLALIDTAGQELTRPCEGPLHIEIEPDESGRPPNSTLVRVTVEIELWILESNMPDIETLKEYASVSDKRCKTS